METPKSLGIYELVVIVMQWLFDQINPVSIVLLILLLGVCFMLGMTVVGICGVHS